MPPKRGSGEHENAAIVNSWGEAFNVNKVEHSLHYIGSAKIATVNLWGEAFNVNKVEYSLETVHSTRLTSKWFQVQDQIQFWSLVLNP